MTTDTVTAGVIADMPDDDYRAYPALSQSGAKLLLPPSCPALYRWQMDHPRPDTAAFDFGHAAHSLTLGIGAPIVAVPDEMLASNGALSTRAAKEFVAEHEAQGATVLKGEDVALIKGMAAALRAHPLIGSLFNPERGQAELSMFWHDEQFDIDRKARLDWLLGGDRPIVVDYKTSVSANPAKFAKSVADFGYHQQDPWYTDGVKATTGAEDVGFVFVVQAKTAPYLVTVVELDSAAVMIGRAKNERAMEIYRDCTAADVWPSYSNDIELVSLPAWADREYL